MWLQVLTGLIITAHGLLGCCWHHPHALAPSEQDMSACHRFHDHAVASRFAPGNHAGDTRHPTGEDCEETDCVYLGLRSVDPPESSGEFSPNPLAATLSVRDAAFRSPLLGEGPPPLETAGSSLRPHLLKQVLLL